MKPAAKQDFFFPISFFLLLLFLNSSAHQPKVMSVLG